MWDRQGSGYWFRDIKLLLLILEYILSITNLRSIQSHLLSAFFSLLDDPAPLFDKFTHVFIKQARALLLVSRVHLVATHSVAASLRQLLGFK